MPKGDDELFPGASSVFLRRLFPQAVNGYEFEKNFAVGYLLNSECEHTIIFKTVSSLPGQTKKNNSHKAVIFLVDDNGLEPLTLRTSSGCSTN